MRFGKPSWPTAEMIAQARHNMATVQNIQSEGLTSRNVRLNTLGGSGDLKGSLTGFSGGTVEDAIAFVRQRFPDEEIRVANISAMTDVEDVLAAADGHRDIIFGYSPNLAPNTAWMFSRKKK